MGRVMWDTLLSLQPAAKMTSPTASDWRRQERNMRRRGQHMWNAVVRYRVVVV
jgi:hypothetical protein